jgi:para-aminobenzoate synthetase component 1
MRPRLSRYPLPWPIDPERAAAVLLGDSARDAFWLDSGPTGRHYLGQGVPIAFDGPVLPTLRRELAVLATAGVEGARPLGLIGWLGYEAGHETVGVPEAAAAPPPAAFLRVDRALVVDAESGAAELVACGAWRGELLAWRERAEAVLAPTVGAPPLAPPAAPRPGRARWLDTDDEYRASIRACLDAIREGEAYQLCLTTRVEVPGCFDDLDVYRRLRSASPSHHGGLLRIGGRSLLSSSPERFLDITSDGRVTSSPIKGTRPRSGEPAVDARLADELRTNEKERAENLMIVDLVRNDLSRVAELGTVEVTRLLEVESYPPVHQLVSAVTARMRPGLTAVDAIAAAFPAGSMTGAPKRRAMQLLAELEGRPRGVYAGAFGWFGAGGAAELAMVIRSIVLEADLASVGTGGGITAGSEPDAELAEARLKAAALLAALGVDDAEHAHPAPG